MEPIQDDIETVRYALWRKYGTPDGKPPKHMAGRPPEWVAALDRLVAERDRLRNIIQQHDGPGYTTELANVVAERDRLRDALKAIIAERSDHLMFTGTHAEDMYAIAREALTKKDLFAEGH